MALVSVDIPPGFVTEESSYAIGPRWIDGDKVRFRGGKPEKIRGWQKLISTTFEGVARHYHGWSSLTGVGVGALGTSKRLYTVDNGKGVDITPVRDSNTLGTDPFTTAISSSTVTVSDTAHGNAIGDFVIFSGAGAVGGITVDGEYTVISVPGANSYTIVDDETASTTATGGGTSVTYLYLLPIGLDTATSGFGWGVATWNLFTWGTRRATSSTVAPLRTWSLDNWGEDLVANVRGGDCYTWDFSTGTNVRATAITNAPKGNFLLVNPGSRHLIVFGAETGGAIDPMLIAWSDNEDFTTWTPAATNSAGDIRLGHGNKIMGALRTRNEILVWTDTALYSMQFIGPPFIFGIRLIATGCGMIGPHAAMESAGRVYWLGLNCHNFYMYSGNLNVIPCPVLNHLQDNIEPKQSDQVYGNTNREEHEMIWLWPSTGQAQNDRYIIFNTRENAWYFGTLDRSLWQDRDNFITNHKPIAIDSSGVMYEHEVTFNNDGSAITAFLESGGIESGEGDRFAFIDKIIPDFETITGSLDLTFKTRRYPNSVDIDKGPFTLDGTIEKLNIRARGRQFRLRFDSDAIDDEWRLGTFRLNVQPDGGR